MTNYELRTERTKTTQVDFDGNMFERIDSKDTTSQTLRLLQDGKLSTVSSSKPDCFDEMMTQAKEMVPYGAPYEETFAEKTDIVPLNLYDNATMSAKEMIEKTGALVADLQTIDSRIIVSAGMRHTVSETSLKTSQGFDHGYKKSMWSCGAGVNLVQGDDKLQVWKSLNFLRPDFDFKGIKNELAQKVEYAKTIVPFEAGSYPVIFTPDEMGFILNPIAASLNGMAIYRKISPWHDKLGQELLDPRFTLYDDGSLDNEHTSKPFDLEGTPTRRNTLVQSGRIQDILLNRKVAAQLGKVSSGNAGPAGPMPNHLIMEAGTKSLAEMIKSIDYGMLIDGSMGAWSGNPFAGIVTGTISMGLKIEKGKIVGRVKDCMFTVNTFQHLAKHLVDASVEREATSLFMVGATAQLPYVMLDEVVISTN